MTIKIPVQAAFDPSSVEQQLQAFQQKLNALGQQIAKANKTQFNPISKASLQDMQQMVRQFEALRRVSGDLNKRINATGQKGKGFLDLDWGAMYPDQGSRARQMAKAWSYVTGQQMLPPSPGPRPPNHQAGPTWQQVGVGAVQAGLRNAGPAGGVAAGALGTGMSAGFGAGLMGLLGGMLALGVGKIVGAATEKIQQAEDNSVAYDRLKRTLGDVNVSFGALKGALHDAAQNTRLTYAETAKLGMQYAKLGNLSGDDYRGMLNRGGELEMGVGLSRAYGLEPEQGVGVLGRMRGIGIAKGEQDARRFALLIGETIGKSNAFAKADEVMEAIADYATMQTRNGMGAANVAGYAGMFSSLSASGIPGLDPAGAGSLLARVNASLTAGGAKGEASQFFSAVVANRMGLDPLQLQVLREGGAFATNDEAFGPGSVAARYGLSGPGGSQTFLSGTLGALRGAYGHDKGLLAQATANHLGVNMRQAMALLSVGPNQMGEMGKYADLTKLSGSGIGNLSKALYGSEGDRKELANSLARRTGDGALSPEELSKLDAAMSSGDADTQKQVLAELVASRDQERTQGSDIRDSKNLLDNIKTSLADKLIPLTEQMRAGIIYMAGGKDKLTTEQIMKAVIENDSKGRIASINGRLDPGIHAHQLRAQELRGKIEELKETRLTGSAMYLGKPELVEQKRKERAQYERELDETTKKITELQKEKAEQLAKENARREKEIDDMTKAAEERRRQEDLAKEAEERRQSLISQASVNSGPGRYGGAVGNVPAGMKGSVDEAMKFFMDKGWSKEQAAGIAANLVAESGMRPGAVGDNGRAYGIAQWHPDRQANFAKWAGKDIRGSSFQDQLGFIHYEMTEGRERAAGNRLRGARTASEAGAIVSRYYERPAMGDWEAAKRGSMAERIGMTPLPQDAAAARSPSFPTNFKGSFDPLEIRLNYPDGKPSQPIFLTPYFQQATPFGSQK